jgi:predicted Rdx family selenoprotein
MNLQIACPPADAFPEPSPPEVEVLIGKSPGNRKCVESDTFVACDSDAGDRGIRINTDYRTAGDTFDVDVDGAQVCVRRTDQNRGWGMNLKISCVETDPPEEEPAPPAVPVDVMIGRSRSNSRCVNAPGPVACAVDAGDKGRRINSDHSGAGDSFEVQVDGNKVCARRKDSRGGWGMNLKIRCAEAEPPPPPAVEINIGKSSQNTRCVDAPSPVACATNAGNQNIRINTDYSSAGDSFEVVMEGRQVCVRRTDQNRGWGMNLQIACPEADAFPEPSPPEVEVLIGKSPGNRKCIKAPSFVACDSDAGDKGIRINTDYAGAGDSFNIEVDGDQVCASRTDQRRGWGMNLKISCVEADAPEEEPALPEPVDVVIGRSRSNRRCVNAPGPVACEVDAGDKGNRINPDHAGAGDSFEVEVDGNKVCARRKDRAQGWGMNLKIQCERAELFPEAKVQINFGKSGENRRCVDAPSPVACASNSGDQGKRVNTDYAGAGDSFEVVMEGNQVCARRTDQNRGWGMNLQVACPAADSFPDPPAQQVQVLIGKSPGNRKCVTAPGPVACDTDAGDQGIRINTDYAGAGDSFDVDVDGRQVCVRRTDSVRGWGMNLKISCVESDAPEEEVDPPGPAPVDVVIGRSRGNRLCVNAPGPVACDVNAGDMGKRINSDHARAGDSFEVQVDGNKVCARRKDRSQGWGMNLKIRCVEAAAFPPANVQINFGRSGENRRCVDAPSPVACAVEAGNMGKRINNDHAGARDAFEVVMVGRQVCARRLDNPAGWGMNLQIACPAADAFPEPPPEDVEVLIGKSGGNRRCVNAPGPVACDTDAGDKGIRINSDYRSAGDSFDIDVDGSQVCARRTDQNRGWGMNLKIACIAAEAPAEEESYEYYSYYYY